MKDILIADKYARAFYHLFPEACTLDATDRLMRVHQFFLSHKQALFFVSLPQIDGAHKQKIIHMLVHKVGLVDAYCTLYMLLLNQKRASLIADVTMQLRTIILQKHKVLECTIASSILLDEGACQQLRSFFEQETGHIVKAQYVVDTSLIAGIALRSETYAWEYSVRKQLDMVRNSLIR